MATEAEIQEHIRKLVDSAPPLSASQIALFRVLLKPAFQTAK